MQDSSGMPHPVLATMRGAKSPVALPGGYGSEATAEREYVERILGLVCVYDAHLCAHLMQTARYAVAIAERLEVPADWRQVIAYAALLHDLGEGQVRHALLRKPPHVTPLATLANELHVAVGHWMSRPAFAREAEIARVFHRPYTEQPTDIPRQIVSGAHILAVAEALETLLSDWRDRPGQSFSAAVAELQRSAGTRFNPRVVKVLCRWPASERDGFFINSAHLVDSLMAHGAGVTVGASESAKRALVDLVLDMMCAYDVYLYGHLMQTSHYARELSRMLGLAEDRREVVRIAALLHDLGKISVSHEILRKPDRLTSQERGQMERHAAIGRVILDNVPALAREARIVGMHHHRYDQPPPHSWDTEVLFEAHIVAVADSIEAMISDRPYQDARPLDVVLVELAKNSGRQFHPDVVRAAHHLASQNPTIFVNSARLVDDAVGRDPRHERDWSVSFYPVVVSAELKGGYPTPTLAHDYRLPIGYFEHQPEM